MHEFSILIVDDDRELLDSMGSWFTRHRFKVIAAHHPRLALAAVAYNDFDAAVIDFKLDEMNGIELFGKLKAKQAFPVIMLTGDDNPRHKQVSHENGVYRHLVKPIRMAELEKVVRDSIQTSANEASQSFLTDSPCGLEAPRWDSNLRQAD